MQIIQALGYYRAWWTTKLQTSLFHNVIHCLGYSGCSVYLFIYLLIFLVVFDHRQFSLPFGSQNDGSG